MNKAQLADLAFEACLVYYDDGPDCDRAKLMAKMCWRHPNLRRDWERVATFFVEKTKGTVISAEIATIKAELAQLRTEHLQLLRERVPKHIVDMVECCGKSEPTR